MLSTACPAAVSESTLGSDDDRYPYSWLPSDDHANEASELAERGPEAFPD